MKPRYFAYLSIGFSILILVTAMQNCAKNNGTETGNPETISSGSAASTTGGAGTSDSGRPVPDSWAEIFATNICKKIESCYGPDNTCYAKVLTDRNVPVILGLSGTYQNLEQIRAAEMLGLIKVQSAPAGQCLALIANLSCPINLIGVVATDNSCKSVYTK